ncbi:MAG: Coproheme decarboxylase HemQ (no EC), partial [uncultured Solirubrobacteraceae bacterium]
AALRRSPPLRQVHVPQGRPGLAAAARRAARRGQARVPRGVRGLRRGPPPAVLLARRDPRRRGPHARHGDGEPRPHPRVPRRPGAVRAGQVVHHALLVPRDAEGVGVLRRVAHDAARVPREVPLRVPLREDPRVVRHGAGRALEDHAGAHQGRAGVPRGGQPHDLLVRPGRPGVRRGLRHGRRRGVPGPRPAPAHHRRVGLHAARHAELHVHPHLRGARGQRPRRGGAVARARRHV